MKKVIGYRRVSTDEQAEKGFSLQHQEDVLRAYCQAQKLELIDIYTDDYSGKDFDRPAWKQLKEYCKKHKRDVDIILTTKWDRWSRNVHAAYSELGELQKMGIEVHTVEQQLDLTNPDNKVLLSIYLTIPEVENMKNSIRTTEASRKARMLGCWTGGAPVGYVNSRTEVDKRSTLSPGEKAPIVTEAFKKMASGLYAADEIRRWMNLQGVKISKNQFLNLVRNIAYTGRVPVKAYKKEPETIVFGLHPPLISDEVFAAANEVLNGRRKKMKFKLDKSDIYPLKGLLRCDKHNLALSAAPSKGRYGTYHYYLCTVKNDRCKRYRIEWVHDLVEQELSKIQFSAGVVALYRTMLSRLFVLEGQERKARENILKAQIEKLKSQKSVLQTHFMEEKITVEEYRELKMAQDDKLYQIQIQLDELTEKIDPISEYLSSYVPMLENLLDFYRSSDGKTKKRILSCIFSEKIHFDENRDAAISYSTPISILLNASKVLGGLKKEKEVKNDLLSTLAPLIDERCSYSTMLDLIIICKLGV